MVVQRGLQLAVGELHATRQARAERALHAESKLVLVIALHVLGGHRARVLGLAELVVAVLFVQAVVEMKLAIEGLARARVDGLAVVRVSLVPLLRSQRARLDGDRTPASNSLAPRLVMMFTTPPVEGPNSAP